MEVTPAFTLARSLAIPFRTRVRTLPSQPAPWVVPSPHPHRMASEKSEPRSSKTQEKIVRVHRKWGSGIVRTDHTRHLHRHLFRTRRSSSVSDAVCRSYAGARWVGWMRLAFVRMLGQACVLGRKAQEQELPHRHRKETTITSYTRLLMRKHAHPKALKKTRILFVPSQMRDRTRTIFVRPCLRWLRRS